MVGEYDRAIGRIVELRMKKEQAKAALERMTEKSRSAAEIDPAKIDAFARLVNEKLETADVNVRRSYIKSVVDGIEVDDGTIRIVGRKDEVADLAIRCPASQIRNGNVAAKSRQEKYPETGIGRRPAPFEFPARVDREAFERRRHVLVRVFGVDRLAPRQRDTSAVGESDR